MILPPFHNDCPTSESLISQNVVKIIKNKNKNDLWTISMGQREYLALWRCNPVAKITLGKGY
jgi:hypothetical protein